MNRSAAAATLGLNTFAVVVVLFASIGAQIPVFKGRLDLVRTEIAVIDNKTGKAVAGLTERDFTISENGVKQTVTTFIDQSATTVPANAQRQTDETQRSRRVFLFVFEVGAYSDGPYKVFEGVAQFIRTKLNPQDLVGILAMTRLSQLTTDHERVAAIVDRLRKPTDDLLAAQAKLTKREGADADTLGLIDQWLEPNRSDRSFFRDASPYLLGTPEYGVNDAADTVRNWRFRLATSAVLKVAAGVEFLRAVPGNKHIVLFSGLGFGPPPFSFANAGFGLYLLSTEDDRRFAARANDAGVAIDVVQTGGAGTDAFSSMPNANVAEHSGGQFSGLRVADQQLARVSDATTKGYVLGYVPSNPQLDAKYRDIKVTVNRKDVTLVYRRGYTATTAPEKIDSREVYARSRMRNAVAGNIDVKDLRVKASAVSTTQGGKKAVKVEIAIDISPLELADVNGRWTDELDLLVVCGDVKMQAIGKLDQRMTLSMSPALLERAKASGVPYSAVIPVNGTPTIARVVVFNFKTDRLGTASVAVK